MELILLCGKDHYLVLLGAQAHIAERERSLKIIPGIRRSRLCQCLVATGKRTGAGCLLPLGWTRRSRPLSWLGGRVRRATLKNMINLNKIQGKIHTLQALFSCNIFVVFRLVVLFGNQLFIIIIVVTSDDYKQLVWKIVCSLFMHDFPWMLFWWNELLVFYIGM